MARVVIVDRGLKQYYDDGTRHRDDGPAVISKDGYKVWYKNGYPIQSFGSNGLYCSYYTSVIRINDSSGFKQLTENGRIAWPKL